MMVFKVKYRSPAIAPMAWSRASTAYALTGANFAAAVYTSHAVDVPRDERLASGKVGRLVEGARTNFIQRANDPANAYWGKLNVTALASQVTGPDGTTSGGLITETGSGEHRIRHDLSGHGALEAWCHSLFVKRATSGTRNVSLVTFGTAFAGGSGNLFVDPDDGTVVTAPSGVHSVIAMPDGWYRIWQSRDTDADGGVISRQINLLSGTTASYAGDGTSNVAMWNFVQEQGAFPSSPMPIAAGANSTRAADISLQTVSPPSGGFALAFEIKTALGVVGNQFIFCLHDGSDANKVEGYLAAGVPTLVVTSGSSVVATITAGTIAASTERKISFSIAANSMNLCNASTLGTRDTSCAMPTGLNRLVLGHNRLNANHLFGHLISYPDGISWLSPVDDAGLVALNA